VDDWDRGAAYLHWGHGMKVSQIWVLGEAGVF